MKLSTKSILTAPLLFLMGVLFITSCKKKNDDPAPAPVVVKPPVSSVPAYYFDGSFGDTKMSYKEGVNNYYTGSVSSSVETYDNATDESTYHFSEGGTWTKIIYHGFNPPTMSDGFSIVYNKILSDIDPYKFPTQADLDAMYPIGTSKLFSTTSTGSYENDGWRISILDNAGKSWDSYYPSGDQSESFVTISSRGSEVINKNKVFSLTGSFSCKVYDEDGNSKVFSGKFYQIFSDYSPVFY